MNDYLYKAVNEKEANAYNTSLKYADRFFPDGYQSGGAELMPYDENSEQSDEERPQNQNFRPQQNFRPEQVYNRPNVGQNRPQQQIGGRPNNNNYRPQQASNNVNSYFTNPEHINIPLNQRRPVPKF